MVIPIPNGEDAIPEEFQEPEYVDEPLDPVARDNLDIGCLIGGQPYDFVQLEVTLTEGPESNFAKGVVIPRGHNREPQPGRGLDDLSALPDMITIDVDNKLTEVRKGTEEITRIFTGVISNSSRIENGAFEFMAFWPGFNQIQNGSIDFDSVGGEKELRDDLELTDAGTLPFLSAYDGQYLQAADVAKQVADFITGDDPRFDNEVLIPENGIQVGGVTYAEDTRIKVSGGDESITSEGKNSGLLSRITDATNSIWEVDRFGNFYIGPPTPDGPFPTSITSHKLRYITETTAGKKSPVWRSVAVIGDGIVTQDGWAGSALVNEDPQKFATPLTTDIEESGDTELSEDLAEPTFVYTNLEINTEKEAKHVLDKIRDDIRKQAAGGEITVVGHPEVWPNDAVEMPDAPDQPFELDRFGVGKVVHRLNNSDGFMTKISVVGQTNAVESIFSDEIEVDEPSRYPTLQEANELGNL